MKPLIDPEFLNDLATTIHNDNVSAGWWLQGTDILTKAQLIIAEIAEATEGARKDLADDHLPHRKMEEVELADTLIRVLDLGKYHGFSYIGSTVDTDIADEVLANLDYPAALHFIITVHATEFGMLFLKVNNDYDHRHANSIYSRLIDSIIIISNIQWFNIFDAVAEKLAYNKSRHDHKIEARLAEGGKKF